jgi:tetratricopeptide (TPR) repeat protein
MARWFALVFLAVSACAASPAAQKQDQPKPPPKEEEQAPPDEDQMNEAKIYTFNPVQAKKELAAGEFYFKTRRDYRAAANRFREATKWNPGFAEAWLRLGDAAEKQNDNKTVTEAYTRYLEIQPEAKNAPEIKKRLEKAAEKTKH